MEKQNKKIEVNASSLVNLKAELFRKQEEFRKAKLSHGSTSRPTPSVKKPNIWSKQNKGVLERSQRDFEEKVVEEDEIIKSRKALEAKTKLYEKLSQDGLKDNEESKQYLVNFQKKAIDEVLQDKEEKEELKIKDENPGSQETVEDYPAYRPEDEWVDYVDSLGRSRRCLRKDLPDLLKIDREFSNKEGTVEDDQSSFKSTLLLAEDQRREKQRLQWEKEEEEARSKPVGPIHYQNVRFQEVRDLGVGYYGFSTVEEEREKQMELLNNLRNQTKDQRDKSQKLKEKRKALLEARLAKVRQRRNKKLGIDSDEKLDDSSSASEKEETAPEELKEPVEEKQVSKEERKNEERSQKVRPWDIGKPGVRRKRSMTQEEWIDKQREERMAEFAPPQFYYDPSNSTNRYQQPKKQSRWNTYDLQFKNMTDDQNTGSIPLPTEQQMPQHNPADIGIEIDRLLATQRASTDQGNS